ncbi:phosphotransferase [uncultured Cellulomonas sp.]|uniref:phosphotransferase n=1 Tax=uncultured Cellulomonas sp. TaxID=189682 RepID=UPI0026256B8F|nr:phosphotransferase [uncultured Cellulomonas sp.]
MTDREVLPGGSMSDPVRVGRTVRRTAGPWTPTVHRLLEHLIAAGVDVVPRPLGIDDDGREVLAHLPGEVPQYPLPGWVWHDDVLVVVARCVARLHAATASFPADDGPWQLPTHGPVEVICHNDLAPDNVVWDRGELVGVLDWDTASPGSRVWDVAYLAYRWVPLADPRNTDALPGSLTERRRRLRLLLGAYAHPLAPAAVLATVVERLRDLAAFTERRADGPGRGHLREHAALYRRDAVWVTAHAAALAGEPGEAG